MKKNVCAVLLVTLLLTVAALGGDGRKYGKSLTVKEPTKISEILAHPDEYRGKRVLVEGTVVDVCKKRGCWISISSDKEFESIQFKVEDGVIVFPLDARGKAVSAEGVVSVVTMTEEQLVARAKHEAEEQGEPFDPSTVKGPKTVIRIDGDGAVVRD